MIDGVKTKQLKLIPDERGSLMELLRKDDEIFEQFGMCYVTTAYPGVTKAWHYHEHQTDHFVCLHGMAKVALYDSRKDSTTYGEINEFFLGHKNPILLKIPKMVYHGYKAIGSEETMLMNIPTRPYNYDKPDEHRIDPHNNDIPYDWNLNER
ncbi:dTDP-4-dehydrorhamnose 3,5-epimerase family protein [Planctomycetota bacterium]